MEETAEYLNDSAVELADEGEHAAAIACLLKALLMEPYNSAIWFNLALSYRATNRLEEAKAALVRAAEYRPQDIDILDTLGVVMHETGNDFVAEKLYLQILDIDPGNGRVWNNYGVLQFGQEKYSEACRSFEKAVTLIPDFYDALYNLRDTYEELGKTAEMKKCASILAGRIADRV